MSATELARWCLRDRASAEHDDPAGPNVDRRDHRPSDVVRLVSEGLANNDIATRLFVSPRTVQSHLTHV
jgi:DNA-binding NarL/FixJ family response regulator